MTFARLRNILEFHTVFCHETRKASLFDDACRLMRISRALHTLEIARCERDLTPRQVRRYVDLLAEARLICMDVLFHDAIMRVEVPDARSGIGLRLHFRSGRSNSFGGEGWNVPTTL